MAETVDAIYEDGVLRPLRPLQCVGEHARVTVTVRVPQEREHPLADCVGILPNEDAVEMSQAVDDAFEQVNLREWE